MDAVTGAGLLVVPSLSCRPQCRRLPKSFPVGKSGLWRRRWTTHRSLLRACYTFYPDGGDELVDVIGIGSRKYSIIDFCLASPSASASRFRFWTIYSGDQKKVQLLERGHSKVELIRNVEFPLPRHSFQPTVILFASTGHEVDHIAAINLLNSIKTAGGLAIAIVLKPFGFEGQRRQKEIDDLVNNLKSCLNFYVVVEADSCFKVGSFAEALESANNKAVSAMNTILSMISKKHSKILDTSEGKVKDVKPSEFVKVLERYGEVKIYYGADYSINAAIKQAILNCPFFHTGLKDISGLAVMNLTCSANFDDVGLHQTIQMFRHITGYTEDIVFSNVLEPNCDLKRGTLLLIMGHNEKMVSRSKGFFSSLLQSLPSIDHFFQLYFTDIDNNLSSSSHGNRNLSLDSSNTSDLDLSTTADSFEVIPDVNEFSDMLETVLLEEESYHEIRGDEIEQEEINHLSNKKCSEQKSGELASVVSMDSNNHTGPAFHVAQLWAKRCFQSREIINDKADIFRSPVGVKSSILFPECSSHSTCLLAKTSEYSNREVSDGIAVDMSKKNSLLSVRTAMMLEAERESSKNWNHIVEIQYRGGIYRGICHGGLPDGKGRLTSTDGSFYEGFWKCGKRSGLGTFCYSNGDLFRGPWRDDLMHGKGWFYFHTGDRWFANFWRGKANGEGRFFSKDGSAFFGNFRDGWRHGQFVSIDSDGSRWKELWEDGVLQDRAPLDS